MSIKAERTAGLEVILVQRPLSLRLFNGLWRFARRQPVGFVAALIILTLIMMAIFADVVAPYDPLDIHRGRSLEKPSGEFWFGTDEQGRDVFSRIIFGSRISLQVGLVAAMAGTMVGAFIGLTTGYWGGKYDLIMQRLIDAKMAFPGLILVMSISAALEPSLTTTTFAISILFISAGARVVRGSTLSTKEQQFVEAARALGASDLRILFRHILPNVFAPIIVLVSIVLGSAILLEASLGFLGLGVPPPNPTWGGMLSGAGRRFFTTAPWIAIAPGLAIGLVVLSFNLLGDALRDTLDPRLRGVR